MKCNKNHKEVVSTVYEAIITESNGWWWLDSGAARHVSNNKGHFVKIEDKALGEHCLYMGNNTYIDVLSIVDYKIFSNNSTIILKHVLFAPTIRRNMIFASFKEKRF